MQKRKKFLLVRKFMTKKLVFIMMWLAMVAVAVPAGAGLVTFIHGLPALPGAIPSSNPVDIAFDGKCEYIYEPYGAKLGPRQIEEGWHTTVFYESTPNDPCRGTVLAATEVFFDASDEVDVTLHLNSEDVVVASVWDNTTALDAIENGAEVAVEVRNAAAGPTLTAVLKKENEEVDSGGVIPGSSLGPIETTAGKHTVQVKNGDETLDQDSDEFKADRVYWVYITGSVFKKTINLLTIESIPGELIEGQPPPNPPKYSTCCYYGYPVPSGQGQCYSTGGLYVGDVAPDPNPCR
jgi:hypothetical protein